VPERTEAMQQATEIALDIELSRKKFCKQYLHINN